MTWAARYLVRCYGYAATGDKAKAMELLKTIPNETQLKFPIVMSQVNVALGHIEEALNYLELGYKIRALPMIFLRLDPAWDPLRSEPRFKALMKENEF